MMFLELSMVQIIIYLEKITPNISIEIAVQNILQNIRLEEGYPLTFFSDFL